MPSLPELVNEFDTTLRDIEELAVDVGAAMIGTRSHITALALTETASDLCAAARALGRAHRRGVTVYRNRRGIPGRRLVLPHEGGGSWVTARQPPELEEVSFLMKAWLFFVSALCDKTYRLLLGRLQDRAAPVGQMSAIEKPANPVALFLGSAAPEIVPWFLRLRKLRNEMKEGTSFGFSQLDARGLGLTIYTTKAVHGPPRDLVVTPGQTVTFADAVEDARRLKQLLTLLAQPDLIP